MFDFFYYSDPYSTGFAKLIEDLSLLNPTDAEYERRISRNDVPHRFVLSGIYELPFGRNRRYGAASGRAANLLVGDYQVQGIYEYQAKRPFELGNLVYFGDPSGLRTDIDGSTASGRVFDMSGFYPGGVVNTNAQCIRLVSNLRTFPSRLSGFCAQTVNQTQFSVIKNIPFTERVRLQLWAEFLNAFNTPIFDEPNLDPTSSNFGTVITQANLPRNVQLAIKLTF